MINTDVLAVELKDIIDEYLSRNYDYNHADVFDDVINCWLDEEETKCITISLPNVEYSEYEGSED